MQCAWAILPTVACPAVQYFSTLSHKLHDFGGGGELLNSKYVFLFPIQLLCETFLILRTERDMIKRMSSGLHVKYPLFLSDFSEA
jgi:hypothetical protein